jgi:hypothetical protein
MYITTQAKTNPASIKKFFKEAWQLAREQKLQEDPRIFFEPIHEAGMALVQNERSLQSTLKYCPQEFRQGCIHGVVMEYMRQHKEISNEQMLHQCTSLDENKTPELLRLNCIHGIGHGILYKGNSLEEGIAFCNTIPDKNDAIACAGGALMEHSRADMHIGTKDIDCTPYTDTLRLTCIYYKYRHKQIHPIQTPFAQTLSECATLPDIENYMCTLGVSEEIVFATGGNLKKITQLCATASAQKDLCLQTATENLTSINAQHTN